MKESAVLFGDHNNLVGVITDPGPAPPPQQPTAVLLLNAGFVHRVGPARIHTKMARRLAEAGFPVLRFDFSGIGDSEARKDALPYEVSTIHEAREAMDLMSAAKGVSRFVLVGICSGASNSLRIALSDPRVVGAVPIESYPFSTTGYIVSTYVRRFFRWRMWWNLLTGKLHPRKSLQSLAGMIFSKVKPGREETTPAWQPPSPKEIIADLRTLVRRGVRLCFINSGLGPAHYYYHSRLQREVEAFSHPGEVRVLSFDETDHTFTPLSQQELLIKTICDWTYDNFAEGKGISGQGVAIEESGINTPLRAPQSRL
ncbi:MAG: hypothetical protein LAO31_10815 [Acidobacteriia bacterium]|nr:hypothetical protein [Terriglobia bacterium]